MRKKNLSLQVHIWNKSFLGENIDTVKNLDHLLKICVSRYISKICFYFYKIIIQKVCETHQWNLALGIVIIGGICETKMNNLTWRVHGDWVTDFLKTLWDECFPM